MHLCLLVWRWQAQCGGQGRGYQHVCDVQYVCICVYVLLHPAALATACFHRHRSMREGLMEWFCIKMKDNECVNPHRQSLMGIQGRESG